MSSAPREEFTRLLASMQSGDEAASSALIELVYDELRAIARHYMREERSDHTLNPTAIVHEVYLRLTAPASESWNNRAHFFAACASAIRRILVDHARSRNRQKRGGDRRRVTLEAADTGIESIVDLVELDDALQRLAELDPQRARVVELRYFGGMSVEQTARFLDVSAPTVVRQWRFAKAWLYRALSENNDE